MRYEALPMLKVLAGGVLQPRMPEEGVRATQNGQLPIANASNCLLANASSARRMNVYKTGYDMYFITTLLLMLECGV
jgi:hypothetical protein